MRIASWLRNCERTEIAGVYSSHWGTDMTPTPGRLDARTQLQVTISLRQLRGDLEQLNAISSGLSTTRMVIKRAAAAVAESRALLAPNKDGVLDPTRSASRHFRKRSPDRIKLHACLVHRRDDEAFR